jgi:hypothetical protein
MPSSVPSQQEDDAWSSDGSDDSFGDVDPAKLKAAMLAVKMNLGDDNGSSSTPLQGRSNLQPLPKSLSSDTHATPECSARAACTVPPATHNITSAASPQMVSPVVPATDSHNLSNDIRVALLRLALCLMIDTTQGVCIRFPFASQRPEDDGVLNVAFLLSRYLSSNRNRMLCLRLAHVLGCSGSIHQLRLLKLLSPFPSCVSAAGRMTRVGQGMFGTVRRRDFPCHFAVAVKELEAPQSIGDRQPLGIVFSEVTSLEVVSAANACTNLHDYGFDGVSWWLMLEWCPSTLKAWRRGLVGTLQELLPLLLRTYKQVGFMGVFHLHF